MTRNKTYVFERTTEVPPELEASFTDIARRDQKHWPVLMPVIRRRSSECYYIREGGRPLLIIGAIQLVLLNPAKELWMQAGTALSLRDLPPLKKLLRLWVEAQPGPIYARSDSPTKARFLEFFDFKLIEDLDGVRTYEAVKWQ